jgi:phage terminase small subunit
MKPSTDRVPPAPEHLQPETRLWYQAVLGEYRLEEHHRRLLQLAAEAYDAAQTARATIARDGRYFPDRFGCPRLHPAVADERDARLGFARLVRQLGLDNADEPGVLVPAHPNSKKAKAVVYRGEH